jgi:hypothetical protein
MFDVRECPPFGFHEFIVWTKAFLFLVACLDVLEKGFGVVVFLVLDHIPCHIYPLQIVGGSKSFHVIFCPSLNWHQCMYEYAGL